MTEAEELAVKVETGIHAVFIIPGTLKLVPFGEATVVEFTLGILDGHGGAVSVPIEMCRPRAGAGHIASREWDILRAWSEAVGAEGEAIGDILEDMVAKTTRLGGVFVRLGHRSEPPNGAERLVIGGFSGVDTEGDMEPPRGK